jgi:PadR family transcriptional regulator PadR
MAFRSDLESIVLAALQEGPLHGYGIVRAIRARSEGVLKLGEGQLYPILHRLEEDGQVKGKWEIQDGKPPRKVYAITEKGGGALVKRRKEWGAFSRAVGNVMQAPMEAKGNA